MTTIDRNNHPAHLAFRCCVRRPRAADHPSPCPHATRPSPLRPRLSSAGRRPSAGVQVSPGAAGPGILSVCTIYFLNHSVLTPISLPLLLILEPGSWSPSPRGRAGSRQGAPGPGDGASPSSSLVARRPATLLPCRCAAAAPLRARTTNGGESVMIWGMCAITFLIHGVLNPFFPAFIADFCCYCSSWTTEGDVGNQVPFLFTI